MEFWRNTRNYFAINILNAKFITGLLSQRKDLSSSYQMDDLSGKQLKQGRIEQPLTTIDLSELENVIYTIKFEDFLEIHRIVKQ